MNPVKGYKEVTAIVASLIISLLMHSPSCLAEEVAPHSSTVSQLNAQQYFDLYNKYSAEKKATEAFNAIDKAVSLEPNNLKYLRTRGDAANALGHSQAMADSYTRILKLQPDDKEALYRQALANSWQADKMEEAAKEFQAYLSKHPTHAEAWINYVNLESWRNNFPEAFKSLEDYHHRFGETKAYLATKARLLSLKGDYQTALTLNEPLLAKDPDNPDLLYTQGYTLHSMKKTEEALTVLNKLKLLHPDATDTKDLIKIFQTIEKTPDNPVSSDINATFTFFKGSDSVQIKQIPLLLNYTLSDQTRLFANVLYEHLSANRRSGLQTINGHASIHDISALAGVSQTLSPRISVNAAAGAAHIEGKSPRFISYLAMDWASETFNATVGHSRNLYRPYLLSTSPLAISLAVMDNANTLNATWQPCPKLSVPLIVNYSSLSDSNHYWHVNIAPTTKVWDKNNVNVVLGFNADYLHFSKQLHHGYYEPNHHQSYQATARVGIVQDESIEYNLSTSVGPGKDENTGGFHLQLYSAANVGFTLAKNWLLSIGTEYDYSGSKHTSYHSLLFNTKLTRHF